ncbi:MAG TPA: aminotransferase class IV [Candidatus Hydrogenedentes bacterium]|nr:aminotransferase class IV [Candidatus Hydrogenedentota bacterium]HOV73444.1 aminotransferase class IV [Candidatus Hydrogenedentota bacterium]
MELIRVQEKMFTHPDHAQRPHAPEYAFGAAFVADHFCPILEAAIPIFDTGFFHADAVYDVVSVSRGAFFKLDRHQARFARACDAIRVRNPFDREQEAAILHELVARAGLCDAYVWWTVTRGIPPMGRNEMVDPEKFQNRFYAFATSFVFMFDDDQRARGIDLIVSRDRIRIPPRAVDPTAKNFHWLDMQMALFEAGARGAEWAVLTDENGCLTEATGANIFAVIDGTVCTPDSGCLEGITRESVLELCEELGIPTSCRRIHADELRTAREAFMTTTAGSIMPVRSVDGKPLSDQGGAGEISIRLHNLYWEKRWNGWHATPVRYELAGKPS